MRTYLHTAIERADADGARPQSSQGGERAAAHAAAAHERPQTAQVGRAAAVTDPGRARRIQTGRALVQVAPIDTPLGPPGAAERPATSHGAATARPASGRGSAVATRQGGSGAAPGMRVAGVPRRPRRFSLRTCHFSPRDFWQVRSGNRRRINAICQI